MIELFPASMTVVFPSVIFGRYFSDKPKFAATKADGREIPVEVHVDRVSMMQLTDDLNKAKDVQDFQEEMRSGARGIRGSQLVTALIELALQSGEGVFINRRPLPPGRGELLGQLLALRLGVAARRHSRIEFSA